MNYQSGLTSQNLDSGGTIVRETNMSSTNDVINLWSYGFEKPVIIDVNKICVHQICLTGNP